MQNRKIGIDEMKSLALITYWTIVLKRAISDAQEASKNGTLDILLYGKRDYFVPYGCTYMPRRNRRTVKGRTKGLLRLRGGVVPEGSMPETDGTLRDGAGLPANEEKTGEV
jgi:hypothetical protein